MIPIYQSGQYSQANLGRQFEGGNCGNNNSGNNFNTILPAIFGLVNAVAGQGRGNENFNNSNNGGQIAFGSSRQNTPIFSQMQNSQKSGNRGSMNNSINNPMSFGMPTDDNSVQVEGKAQLLKNLLQAGETDAAQTILTEAKSDGSLDKILWLYGQDGSNIVKDMKRQDSAGSRETMKTARNTMMGASAGAALGSAFGGTGKDAGMGAVAGGTVALFGSLMNKPTEKENTTTSDQLIGSLVN